MFKTNLKFCLVLIFTLSIVFPGKSQTLIDKELTALFDLKDTLKQDFKKPLKEADNEIDIVLSTGFLIYKKFVSSQDKPSCVFSPSCSEFTVEAFREKGVFMGWLTTFDRLSRCHGFVNQSHYHFDVSKKLFYDPVE